MLHPIEIDQGFLSILLIIFASAFKTLDLAGGLVVFFTILRLFETCKDLNPFLEKTIIHFIPSPFSSSSVKALPSSEEKEIEMKEILPFADEQPISTERI